MDQIARHRADDMRAENAISLGVREEFDKPIGGKICFRSTVAHERKLASLVSAGSLFQLFFGLTDCRNFGMRVDHTWDHVIVHMAGLPGQNFSHGHAFVFGLMGQHWTCDGVANGIDARNGGRVINVGLDLAARG